MREQKFSASGSIVSVEQTEQERVAVERNIYPLNHHNTSVLSALPDTPRKSILKSVSPLALTSLAVLGVMTAPGYTQSCSSSTNSSTKVKTFNCSTSFNTSTSAISIFDGTNAIVMNIASGVTMSSTAPTTEAISIRTSGDGVTITQASGGGAIHAGRILTIRAGQGNLTASVSVTLTGDLRSTSTFGSTAIHMRNYEYDNYAYLPGKVELTFNNLSANGSGVFLGGGGDVSITANSITALYGPVRIESRGTDSSNITVNVSSISLTGSNFRSDNRNNGVHIEAEQGGNITISATTIAGGQYPIWIDHRKGSGTISISADNIEASSTIQNNQSHGSYGVRISRSASSSGPTTITSQGVQRRAKTAINFAHAGSGSVKIYGFTVSASQRGFDIRTKDAVTISGTSSTKPLSLNVTSSTGGEAIKVSRLPPASVGNISINVQSATSPRTNIDVRNAGAGNISITATGNLVTRSTTSATAIIAVNSNSSAGSVSVSANNVSAKNLGIYVLNRGSGGTTITGSGTISSQNHGIQVKDYNSGDVKVTLTSSTSVNIDNARSTGRTGLYITKSGTGDVEISAGSISSVLEGIIAGTSSGDLKITLSGDVTAGTLTSLNDIAGIKAISYGGSSTIVLNSGTTISAGGNNGRGIYAKGSGEIKIQAATVKGTGSGIYVSTTGAVTIEPSTPTTLLKVSATASGGNNAIHVKRGIGATGNVTISAYDAVSNKRAIYVSNSGAGNITITSSGLLQASGSFNSVQVRKTGNLSGDISVTVKNVRSVGNRGIDISNRGTGGTSVRINGTVTADSFGVSIYDTRTGDISVTLASGASISTSSGTNARRGIYARKGGGITADGKVTVTTAGPITAATDGIYVAAGVNDSAYITVNGNITAGTTTLSTVVNNAAIKPRTTAGRFADITINGGVISGGSGTGAKSIDHNRGRTRVRLNGGTIASPVDIGSEADLFTMNSGNLNANVSLGSGGDTFTFTGGTISSGVTIDGGAGTDNLIVNIGSSFNFSGVSNFESLTLGSNTSFSSSAALFNFASITANGTISFSNNESGNDVGFTTNLSGTGVLIVDAIFTGSEPSSDQLTITGNISGSLKLRINDLSTSGATRSVGPFTVLTVTGTASSGALSLENNSIISGNVSYTLQYQSASKSFRLVGLRSTLRCTEGSTQGIFTCAGAVAATESMIKSGNTNIVTTLDSSATVNVSSDVAFRLTGANGLSFSQGSSGNNFIATAAAKGIIDAQTTGTGAVSISLTGSALLNISAANASGVYVKASTGNVTISSSGAITMTSTGGIAHGVRAIATTGDVSVNVSGKVSVLPYDRAYGIHVSATTGDVTISAPGGVHAEGSSRSSVGIFAKTTTGDISITTSGEVRTSNSGQNIVALTAGGDIDISTGIIVQGRYSISANNSSSATGDINITTVGNITATTAVFYVNNSGNNSITINASGDLEGTSSSNHSVVYANHNGNGTISVTTSGDITGGKYAIYVEGKGSLTVNVNDGDVTSRTGSSENAGIYVKNSSNATGPISVNIASGASVTGGGKGIYAWDYGSSQNISITATGTISGILSHGIRAYQKNSGNVTISAHTVTSSASQGISVYLNRSGNSSGTITGEVTLVSGGRVTSSGTGIYFGVASGTGINTVISAYGSVTSSAADAIYVKQTSDGAGTVSIKASGAILAGTLSGSAITGGRHGIYIKASGGGGDKTITTAGTISATKHGIKVKSSTGGGNISISAAGTITAGGEYGIEIDPRGPGTISITATSITAGNFGVYMDSGYDRGTSGDITVSVNGNITITGANTNQGSAAFSIDMEGDHKGDININMTGDISSTGSGLRIGHYGAYSSGDVSVNMSGDMTASRDGIVVFASGNHDLSVTFTGTMSVASDSIELYLDDGYIGDLTIVAHGSFTSSGSRGTTALSAYNESSGNTSITVSGTVKSLNDYGVFQKSFSGDVTFVSHSGSVIEGKKVGVWIANKGANVSYSGPTTVTASGTIKGGLNNTAAVNGLEVQHYGTNLILSAEDVQGTKHGIEAVHGKDGSNRTGSFSVTIVGDVVASGATAQYGILMKGFSTAPTASLTVNSGATVTGIAGGIKVETKASSGSTITTSGAVTGTRNGIIAINSSGNNSLTIGNNVTATASGAKGLSLFTNNGTSTVVINSGTISAEVAISDDESNTSVTVNSGATISGEVRLSGGVDVLTFNAGSSFDSTAILDGGEDAGTDSSIDVLTFNSFSGAFETAKWLNWEKIVLGTSSIATIDGTVTIGVSELTLDGTLSLASEEAGDAITIGGNFTGAGIINLDIDFLTGSADTLTIEGNVTGVKTIAITDVSGNGFQLDTSIDIITVNGTVAEGAFSIGGSQFVSGSYRYALVFNASTKTFTLSGETRNIRCRPTSVGVYGCAGTVAVSEYFFASGSANIVATLSGNTTSEVRGGRAFNFQTQASITLTQAANGGELKAQGTATGVIYASTSGNGNVSISLTGTASLVNNGKAIEALSTGNGNIVIRSTAKVSAAHPAAVGVYAKGAGARVEIDVTEVEAGSQGIYAKNVNGATTVQTRGALTSSGTGIYAYSRASTVTVNASGVTATRSGVVVKNTGSAGSVSVRTSGTVSANNVAVYAMSKEGSVTVNAVGVVGNGSGVVAKNTGTKGAASVTTTGEVSTSGTAIYASSMEGNVSVNASATTGNASGVVAKNEGSAGSVTVTATQTVTSNGTAIYAMSKEGSVTVNALSASGSSFGIRAMNTGTSGSVAITSTGMITSSGTAVYGSSVAGTITVNLATAMGTSSGVVLKNTGDTGSVSVTTTNEIKSDGTALYAMSKQGAVNATVTDVTGGNASGIVLKNTGSAGSVTIRSTGTVKGSATVLYAMSKDGAVTINVGDVEVVRPSPPPPPTTGTGTNTGNNTGTNTGTSPTPPPPNPDAHGIIAKAEGSGAVSVTISGNLDATGSGIHAYSKSASVTVNAVAVSATRDAIIATNSGGTGGVTVTTSGTVTSQSGVAINARVQGDGGIDINANNDVTASGTAISAFLAEGGTTIAIDAGNVTGGRHAIDAWSNGSGAITINLSGNVVARTSNAIKARHDNSGDITIVTAHTVSGGNVGAAIDTSTAGATTITLNTGAIITSRSRVAIRNGDGNSTVTVNAGVTLSGGIELGGGTDRLTFATNSFGSFKLDGGTGSGDVLTVNDGNIALQEDQFVGWEEIILSNRISLSVSGEQSLTVGSLTLKGTLNLQDGESNDTLTVSGAFVGGGSVLIDVDFAGGTTDQLIINGAVTDKTTISLRDVSRIGGRARGIAVVRVGANTAADAFSLDKIYSSGGVSYRLEYDAEQRAFVLAGIPVTGPMLTAMPITLFDSFARAPSLNQRLGGRHLKDANGEYRKATWTRVISGKREYGTMSDGASEFETATLGYQAGYDFAVIENPDGVWIFSVTAQNATVETDIVTNNETGLYESESVGIGATATWYRENGMYIDMQTQFNQISTDLSSANSSNILKENKASAQFISFEIGQRMEINSDITLVGQFQTSWGRVISRTVDAPNGIAEFGLEGGGTLRLGGGAEFGKLGDTRYEGYIRGNIYHDTMDAWDVNFASRTFSDEIESPTSIEFVAGGSFAITDNALLFMQGTYRNTVGGDFADDAEKPSFSDFSAGFKWSW